MSVTLRSRATECAGARVLAQLASPRLVAGLGLVVSVALACSGDDGGGSGSESGRRKAVDTDGGAGVSGSSGASGSAGSAGSAGAGGASGSSAGTAGTSAGAAGAGCAGADLESDPDNCGTCGAKCEAPNVTTTVCDRGACVIGECAPGYVTSGFDPFEFGCDYQCPVWPYRADDLTCDNIDDDCDRSIDDDCPALKCTLDADCDSVAAGAFPPGCAVGQCVAGTCELVARDDDGDLVGAYCVSPDRRFRVVGSGGDCDDGDPSVRPGAWDGPADPANLRNDACNGIDEDCDGMADSGFVQESPGVLTTCGCTPGTLVPCAGFGGYPVPIGPNGPMGVCDAGAVLACGSDGKLPLRNECSGVSPMAQDLCDRLDEDCNGLVDDVLYMNPTDGRRCIAGELRQPCRAFEPKCPSGFTCEAGYCATE